MEIYLAVFFLLFDWNSFWEMYSSFVGIYCQALQLIVFLFFFQLSKMKKYFLFSIFSVFLFCHTSFPFTCRVQEMTSATKVRVIHSENRIEFVSLLKLYYWFFWKRHGFFSLNILFLDHVIVTGIQSQWLAVRSRILLY